jgi:hypothetical protein
MDASQFTIWLQGFAELNAEPPTKEQWQSIREHLQLVFTKVTPEVKPKARIDMSGNEEVKRLIGKAREGQYQPAPASVYQPYFLVGDTKAGVAIC